MNFFFQKRHLMFLKKMTCCLGQMLKIPLQQWHFILVIQKQRVVLLPDQQPTNGVNDMSFFIFHKTTCRFCQMTWQIILHTHVVLKKTAKQHVVLPKRQLLPSPNDMSFFSIQEKQHVVFHHLQASDGPFWHVLPVFFDLIQTQSSGHRFEPFKLQNYHKSNYLMIYDLYLLKKKNQNLKT